MLSDESDIVKSKPYCGLTNIDLEALLLSYLTSLFSSSSTIHITQIWCSPCPSAVQLNSCKLVIELEFNVSIVSVCNKGPDNESKRTSITTSKASWFPSLRIVIG